MEHTDPDTGPCMDPDKGPDRVLCTGLGRDRDTDLDKGHGKDPAQPVGEPHRGLAVQRTEAEGLPEAADIQEAGTHVEAGRTRVVPVVEALHLSQDSQAEPHKLEEVDSRGDTWRQNQDVPCPSLSLLTELRQTLKRFCASPRLPRLLLRLLQRGGASVGLDLDETYWFGTALPSHSKAILAQYM